MLPECTVSLLCARALTLQGYLQRVFSWRGASLTSLLVYFLLMCGCVMGLSAGSAGAYLHHLFIAISVVGFVAVGTLRRV